MRTLSLIFCLLSLLHPLDAKSKSRSKDDIPTKPALLLVTGCGRSGTNFMAKFMKASGFRFHHETPGADGCASWAMAVNQHSPWGPSSIQIFRHCFHQTRDPLAVITSWYINFTDLNRDEWKFIRQYVPEIRIEDPLLVQCAKYWYYWNLLAERRAEWRYRIEDLRTLLPEFNRRLGTQLSLKVLDSIPTDTNSWEDTSHKIQWSDLKNGLPDDLYQNLRQMALRYGYSAPSE